MKSTDAVVAAWEKTLARKGDAPAIFDTRGAVVRTFRGVDENARAIEASLRRAAEKASCFRLVSATDRNGLRC